MPVTMIVGEPGAGKSFVLASIAARRIRRDRRPVFANFSIAGAERFELADMPYLPPSTVLLDEAQNVFHARMWSSMPPSMLEKWSQTRHMGWDLFLGTQHESNVDAVVRRVVHYGVLLSPRWSVLSPLVDGRVRAAARDAGEAWRYHRHPLLFHGDRWRFREFRRYQRGDGRRGRIGPVARHTWRWSWEIAESYDTFENVALRATGKQVQHEEPSRRWIDTPEFRGWWPPATPR